MGKVQRVRKERDWIKGTGKWGNGEEQKKKIKITFLRFLIHGVFTISQFFSFFGATCLIAISAPKISLIYMYWCECQSGNVTGKRDKVNGEIKLDHGVEVEARQYFSDWENHQVLVSFKSKSIFKGICTHL